MGSKHNKPIVLSLMQEGDPLPASISLVLLQLANKESHHVFIDTTLNGEQLKQLVYKCVSPTLAPRQMTLEIHGRRIKDDQCIGELLTLKDVITQGKIPLGEISNIEFLSQIEDEISLEKGVIRMPCGHLMGRQSILSLLECVANEGRWEIFCPFEGCGCEWDYSFCRKLGALTNEEDRYFSNKFNQNWLQRFTKRCPGCKIAIEKEGGSNKIKCSSQQCNFGYFCFLCFRPWRTRNYLDCGNEECGFSKNQAMMEERKQVLLANKDGEDLTISIPCIRFCPGCRIPIEHISGCKHMKCFNCKLEFCFVCLAILKRTWPCGNFNEYCGTVADVQKLGQ